MSERKTIQGELDRLIAWRKSNRPDQIQPIAVDATADTVRKFARVKRIEGERYLVYQGFVILAKGLGRKGEIRQEQLDAWGYVEA